MIKHGVDVYLELAEHIGYDAETGRCFWLADRWRRTGRHGTPYLLRKAGDTAGSFDKRTGYIFIRAGGDHSWVAAHRFALFCLSGDVPPDEVDHINGIRNDNRAVNLRIATKHQNQRNARRRKDNSTGFKGVRRDGLRFSARCRVGGKRVHLGTFDTAEEAHNAYLAAAAESYGDFARAG